MEFHILTLFPEMVMQGLSASIIGRAAERGLLSIEAVDIRNCTQDRHKKVDDYPYGGGAGMLMQAQPVYDAWRAVQKKAGRRPRTVYLTPQGETFSQGKAKELAREESLVLLCGHYEGIDERVLEEIVTDYVSIGDYVLTGGELPAMVMVDAIARMVPGVLGNDVSGAAESFEGNLLEYPQYSRPREWMGKKVPQVLLSGDQKKIRAWRRQQSAARTKTRRPDIYRRYEELLLCREILKKQKHLHIDMTELIDRGQARLVAAEGENICLQDMASGIYFHTAEEKMGGQRLLECLRADAKGEGARYILRQDGAAGSDVVPLLLLHQEFMMSSAEEILGMEEFLTCYQVIYTRKEKLPVAGLYSPDGSAREGQPVIRKLELCDAEVVVENYDVMDDPAYVRERIEKGFLFGAFFGEELAGFVGLHAEGSIGMLTVLPKYRGRKLGRALETYIINLCLEQGFTPYGQVETGNEASLRLQESLGLFRSKWPVYFMEGK